MDATNEILRCVPNPVKENVFQVKYGSYTMCLYLELLLPKSRFYC